MTADERKGKIAAIKELPILLETIPDDAWERTGQHPERGEISLEHVEQITGLRKGRGW